jgi:hypothetical protein
MSGKRNDKPDLCLGCSVKMFGTGSYYDEETNSTVYVDFMAEDGKKKYCKEHCHWNGFLKAIKDTEKKEKEQ